MEQENKQATTPVTVLTGFLGSGKTTLLNYILKTEHGKKIAVIENEFGEVGIDDGLVISAEEEIFEMNNGCVCCTVRGDLIRILSKLALRRNKFDYVLIETTGLADPAPVAQTFFVDDQIKQHFHIDGIITVCDAKHLALHLDDQKEEGVENEAVEQIAFADRILMNKKDLVTEEELAALQKRIHEINSGAPIQITQNSVVDLNFILGIKAFDLQKVLESEPTFLEDQDHEHDSRVTSIGIELEGNMDLEKLNEFISTLLRDKGPDIFRMKGILSMDGSDNRFVFQGVHMLFDGKPDSPWPKDQKRLNRMVFIGRNLNRNEITEGFKSCLVK